MLYLIVSNSPTRVVLDYAKDQFDANLRAFECIVDGAESVSVEPVTEEAA